MGQKLRIKNKLTSLALKKITHPGRYSDGNNLYLKVEKTGFRSWILRLTINGKRRDMGLGSFSFINLNDARELAHKYNKLAKSGIDPIQERLKEISVLIDLRFGHGTWASILAERKKRIDQAKKEETQRKLEASRKQEEIFDLIKISL